MTEDPFDAANALLLLQSGARALDLPLAPDQLAQFERYYQELVTWNKKFNLTAITDYADVQAKHFLDSLAGWPILAEELNSPSPAAVTLRMADVGTGAGFPGIPLKILAPNVNLTLMDGTGKKIKFLTQVITDLGLSQVTPVQGRAEELGRTPDHREQYDVVTARAVAALNTLVEYLLPLVRVGGFALIYKGPSAPQEFMEARKAIDVLGGEMVRLAPLTVPHVEGDRFILLIKKVRPTPNLYPRGQGLARRQPIS